MGCQLLIKIVVCRRETDMLAIGLSFVLASRRVPVPEIIAAGHRVIHTRVGYLAELDKWWQRCSGSTSALTAGYGIPLHTVHVVQGAHCIL